MGSETAGLLLVDKPEGPTSHDLVVTVRRASGTRRVGHTGTLDPFASGLLLICIGWVTRLAEYLVGLPKVYRGVIRLGAATNTDDRTGRIVTESDGWRQLRPATIREVAGTLVGRIEQRPPIFSAMRLRGKRAYALARAGGQPDLVPRRIEVKRLELGELALPDVHFEIECSSGTYVRAVARDLGEGLGVGAHLAQLRRIRVGEFRVEDALEVGDGTPEREIRESLLPATAALSHLPRVNVDGEAGNALAHGRAVTWEGSGIEGPVAVHAADVLLAIGIVKDGRLWPKKVFATSSG